MKTLPQKTADKILERIELEEKLMLCYEFGKSGKDEAWIKNEITAWLDKKFPDVEAVK